jgi:DNA ligase-4
MSESTVPEKKTKPQLEHLVKTNGGKVFQTKAAAADMICVSERSEPLVNQYKQV